MYSWIPRSALIPALFFLSCAAAADESESRSFSLPNHATLQFKVPKSWQSRIAQPPGDLPPTVTFAPQGAPSFQVFITPLWAARPGITLPGPAEIRRDVEQAAEKAKSEAVERELPISELKGAGVTGYYFSATDKAPKPDEYKYMTQGMVRLDELLLTFTALTNDGYEDIAGKTLALLQSAAYANAQPSRPSESRAGRPDSLQITQQDSNYLLTVPVSQLVMSVPKRGFSQQDNPFVSSAKNPRYFYFTDPVNHLTISGWFEPEQQFKGMQQFWTDETNAWKKNNLPEPRDVSFTKFGKWDAIVYDINTPVGVNSHLRAHWIQAGTWIDVHLSVVSSQSSQDARSQLASLLAAIAVTEKN